MPDIDKINVEDFAILGCQPAFEQTLHVGRPNIGNRERFLERVSKILDCNWLTNHGPFVKELEEALAARVGAPHCISMCNGTIALEIAIRALGLQGEVILPSFTFIATAHALQWQQITPVFCDIDPATHNMDPEAIEKLITPRTSGIIGVHVWGRPCNVEALDQVARRHKLKLLFDSAHAFGCSYRGKMIGGLGHTEVFSFHATKIINSFEGGAILTDDDELANKMRLMSNFGFVDRDKVIYPGTNGKMIEVCAAMCLTSLESHEDFVRANEHNYEVYKSEIDNIPGISMIKYDKTESCNFQYIVTEVDDSVCPLNRDQLVDILIAENVLARKYFWPGCHRMEPYRSYSPNASLLLPNTEEVARRVMLLPTGTAVKTEQIQKICNLIRQAIQQAPGLLEKLSTRSQQPEIELV